MQQWRVTYNSGELRVTVGELRVTPFAQCVTREHNGALHGTKDAATAVCRVLAPVTAGEGDGGGDGDGDGEGWAMGTVRGTAVAGLPPT